MKAKYWQSQMTTVPSKSLVKSIFLTYCAQNTDRFSISTPVRVVSAISLPSNGTNPNLQAYVLSAVLDPPPPLPDALSSTNLTAFQAAAQQTSYLDSLESAHGITVFAPSNEAIALALANNTDLKNISTLTAVIKDHVINGTSAYSTQFPLNATSASGEQLTIITNSSGAFISSGSSTAKIIQPDILTSNGVVHVIDGVLLNVATNQTAASSAYVFFFLIQMTMYVLTLFP